VWNDDLSNRRVRDEVLARIESDPHATFVERTRGVSTPVAVAAAIASFALGLVVGGLWLY